MSKANPTVPATTEHVPSAETKRPQIIWFRRDDGDLYDAIAGSDRAKYLAKQTNFEQIEAPKE
jgi:hypothetical protein